MRFFLIVTGLLLSIIFYSCSDGSTAPPKELTREEKILANIDTFKAVARDGDLVVRLTDDVISQQVKYLNQRDPSFSHAGIIVTRNGQKMVCNIGPDKPGSDTVKFEPIDSFINTKNHVSCALYRYDFSASEASAFVSELENYHANNIRFDIRYALETDSVIYCSEMIYKSIQKATNNRIKIELYKMPKRLIPAVQKFFRGVVPEKEILYRDYLAIDNLYMIEECTQIMKFPLKYFPGQ